MVSNILAQIREITDILLKKKKNNRMPEKNVLEIKTLISIGKTKFRKYPTN